MKDVMKMVVTHFFVICVAVMFFTTISNFCAGMKYLPIDYPFQILLTGLITALPSMLFYFRNEPSKKQYYLRFFLHFCIIEAIVMTEGALLGWYKEILEGILIFITVILVYAVVLLYTKFSGITDASKINKALQDFQDKDEKDD